MTEKISPEKAITLACPHVNNRGENPLCIASKCMAWCAPEPEIEFVKRKPDAEGPEDYEDLGIKEYKYQTWTPGEFRWWKFWKSGLKDVVEEYRLWRSPEPVEKDGYCALNQEEYE
jgi:hypothetical protein